MPTTPPSSFSLRPFLGIYFGCLALFAVTFAGLVFFNNDQAWPGMGLILAFALLGIPLYAVLNRTIVRPASAVGTYAERLLQGRFTEAEGITIPAPHHPVEKLAARYKERLGFSHSILEGLPLPIITVDTDQRFTFMNQECLDMLGAKETPESYNGKMMSQLIYKDDRRTKIANCMESDTRTMNLEAVFKHADGNDVHVLANLFPLHDVEGNVIGGCCVYLETTELKLREAEIRCQNEQIASAASQATGIAEKLTSATTHFAALVEKAKAGTDTQTVRINETATAMEEMNATVMEVARHSVEAAEEAGETRNKAAEGAAIVTEVVDAINEVATHAVDLRTSMEQLDHRADDIGKVLNVIEDIADQTNLLALNAAIEAARAGDAGRGFAVVADEVRKLAEKTMDATSEVHRSITGIQEGARANVQATGVAVDSVHRSTEMASRSGEALNAILSMADITADRVRSIATAAEQQSAASEEINRATLDVSSVCADTEQLMADASQAVTQLSRLAESLMTVVREMK